MPWNCRRSRSANPSSNRGIASVNKAAIKKCSHLMRLVQELNWDMTSSNNFAKEIARFVERVGTSYTYQEYADCTLLRRFATAVSEDHLGDGNAVRELGHWAMFKDDRRTCYIAPDGHATDPNGVIPLVTHSNRMLVASSIDFYRPMQIGQVVALEMTLKDIRKRCGASGPLLLVDTERTILQAGELVLSEVQTMAYLANRPSGTANDAKATTSDPCDEVWTPTAVDLFRFSAATFNAHRIHYDLPYARDVEGYPALVVQGPFTAAKLLAFAKRFDDRHLRHFAYRATAPLFVDRPIRFYRSEADDKVLAIRDDGVTAMTAVVSFA